MAPPSDELEAALLRLEIAERELESLRAEVAKTDRLITLGGVAATIAHELNNLLTPALGYAKLAQRSPDRRELTDKAIQRTIEAIEAAGGILESTLDLATGSSTHPEGHSEAASVAVAFERAMACLARDPERDGITVEPDFDPDLLARIEITGLQQIFVNLLTNSCRALRSRGFGTIQASARIERDAVTIRIADDGPGLPAEVASRIFEPFVTTRTPLEDDPQAGGRGLGLTICRRTVEAAGGFITASNRPDGGAVFEIRLPLARPGATDDRGRPRRAA